MKLTTFESDTAVWKKIEAELTTRLDTMRIKNDGSLPEMETAKLRGQIAMCKEILEWSKPVQRIEA